MVASTPITATRAKLRSTVSGRVASLRQAARTAAAILFLTSCVVPADARIWTDSTGRHKTDADFVELKDGVVRLKKANGKIVFIPIERLSKADREFVKSQASSPFVVAEEYGLPELVKKLEPSLVLIETETGLGSGFVADGSGLVITNYHVIEDARSARVTFENGLSAEVAGYVAVELGRDLALLKIKTKARLTPIPLCPKLPSKGEKVATFGAPRGFAGSVSDGVVSGIRKGAEIRDILLKTIGVDLYSLRGLDLQATWIQTTTPISPGNSGGPLVNMKGEVVGANTLIRTDAQNLNPAISVQDIRKLLENAGDDCRPLATLPRTKRPGGHVQPSPRVPAVTFSKIELPSGKTLTQTMVGLPERWKSELFPPRTPIYLSKYPNGEIRGVYAYSFGKLHGPAVTLHENGELSVLANYHMAQLDGQLRMWDEDGRRLLFREYSRDRKNGLVCLFSKGLPWLIQEWDKNSFVAEYLIEFTGRVPSVVPKKDLGPEKLKELVGARKRLYELEAELRKREVEIKKRLVVWYREEDRRIKQKRAAIRGPAVRRDITDRVNARRAAREAYLRALRRASTRR